MKRLALVYFTVTASLVFGQRSDAPGPSILSRGIGAVIQGGGDLLRVRPYFSMTGDYDTGLVSPSVDSSGKIATADDYGGRLEFGATGYHSWRRSMLGLDYRGNVQHYGRQSYYDSTNHTLILGVTHELSRKFTFAVREAAGTFSRDYGTFNSYAVFDARYANVPTEELFNGRTNYSTSMGDLTFTATRRLSFNMGGSGMFVRRRSAALVGMTGAAARGDMQYRLGPRVSLGVDYAFNRYSYTRSFGTSDIHTVAADLAVTLGRNWSFGVRAGGARAETLGLQRVAVDPIIAAITGQGSDYVVMYRLNYVPAVGARLTRAWRRSAVSVSGEAGTTPGNGVYLTSRSASGSLSFSHTATRRWNVGASAGYSEYSSLMSTMGKYRGLSGGGGVTFQMSDALHFVARYDARRYEVQQSSFGHRISHHVSVGFAFSPGELPLSLW